MFDLKADKKLYHHYIIGVSVRPATSCNPGELYLKYGPVHFTHDDIERMMQAAELSNDKIYTKIYDMSNNEILEFCDIQELAHTFMALRISANINNSTLHHFSSEFEISDWYFELLVKDANNCPEERKKLNDSRI